MFFRCGTMQVVDNECWTMSAEADFVAAVKNVEEALAKKGLRLPSYVFYIELLTVAVDPHAYII